MTLPSILLKKIVENTLLEDLGRHGDITSQAIIPEQQHDKLHIISRQEGVLAGLSAAAFAFELMDHHITFNACVQDGQAIHAGQILAEVSGPCLPILAAERTALNFLTHLSGIASQTAQIVHSIRHTSCKICCTRKTLPGLRTLQKYAVKMGGGENHRFGLDDAILIKDNHIALAGGIDEAIRLAQQSVNRFTAIEVEVDTLEQLAQVLKHPVQHVLLDNMNLDQLKQAVKLCHGKVRTEASGGITPANVQAVAETGVDYIAMGCLTHTPHYLDIGLDKIAN